VLTKDEAKQLVYERINAEDPNAVKTVELAIIDNETIEKEYGWVFSTRLKTILRRVILLTH